MALPVFATLFQYTNVTVSCGYRSLSLTCKEHCFAINCCKMLTLYSKFISKLNLKPQQSYSLKLQIYTLLIPLFYIMEKVLLLFYLQVQFVGV